jgi:dihydrodipicolinate synthase/N-acetylneuraminate lyase
MTILLPPYLTHSERDGLAADIEAFCAATKLGVIAAQFYAAVRGRHRDVVHAGLRDFILPLIAIRNRRKGYAVSIIEAGMNVIGRDAGPVRPYAAHSHRIAA